MAKKKTSSKKPVLKKVSKKNPAKKVAKKPAAPKKKVAPVKKIKKAVVKKTAAKKSAKAVAKKPVKKASPVKSAPKKVQKSAGKAKATVTKAAKATVPKATAPQSKSPAKTSAPAKKLDLSGFVTPLDDRLIVQIASAERMTAGGLYIPDTVSDVSGNIQGHVLAVGRGHLGKKGHMTPMDVKVGDSVVFPEHAGSVIKLQNEDLIILREGDVMGIVSK